MVGGGLLLDVPVTDRIAASASAEMMAMPGANITLNNLDLSHSMGTSAEERLSLGLDGAVQGRLHVKGNIWWEHYNWAGYKPSAATYFLYEPLSTTTSFGLNVGVAYSF